MNSLCWLSNGQNEDLNPTLNPIRMLNVATNLQNNIERDKMEEVAKAFNCLGSVKDKLSSHPLIQQLGVKVVNPNCASTPFDSRSIFKKKKLLGELGHLVSTINYGAK